MGKLRSEKGAIWGLTLALLALGALVAVPVTRLSSTSAIGANRAAQQLKDRYAVDAGLEHALWRLQYEAGFASLTSPTTYSQTFNSRTVSITVIPPPPPPGPICNNSSVTGTGSGGNIGIANTASPSTITPHILTTFTFTLTIQDTGTSTIHINAITNTLPTGFTYVAGSADSQGISFKQGQVLGEPALSTVNGRQQLAWSFSPPQPSISASETGTVTFRATATLEPGFYCNEAVVTPDPNSYPLVGTGEATPIVANWPQYDITSVAGATTLDVRAERQDIGMVIRSLQAR